LFDLNIKKTPQQTLGNPEIGVLLAHQKKAFITFYYNVFDVAQGLCGGPKPTGQV
jgi:hypothetical protein